MNRLMKSIVLDAVFAGLLIAGLYYGVDGAMNVISGVIVIAFLLSLSLFAVFISEVLSRKQTGF